MNADPGFRSAAPAHDSADEEGADYAYRSVSGLAVLSLILGLASPLAVLGSLLLAVPLAGAAAALLAMRRIALSDGSLTGRRAAVIGLALSTVFGIAIVSHATITRHLRGNQAAEVGRRWIERLLAGDTAGAFRLMVTEPFEPTKDENADVALDPYLKFVDFSIVKTLKAKGPEADVVDEGTVRFTAGWGGEFVVQRRYFIQPRTTKNSASIAEAAPMHVLVNLRRERLLTEAGFAWVVASTVDENEESAANSGRL